jgi:hypothetical protein
MGRCKGTALQSARSRGFSAPTPTKETLTDVLKTAGTLLPYTKSRYLPFISNLIS